MSKQPPPRYTPGNLPDTGDGLIQFLFDELPRIAAALNKFPSGMSVSQAVNDVPVTTVPTEFRLFEDEPANFDIPGGGWDIPLGEWTVPATGLYVVTANVLVAPFGAGNKDYAVQLTLYIDNVQLWRGASVGQDNLEIGASVSAVGRAVRDSVIRATITLVHDQFVGTTTVTAQMGITSTVQE